MARFKTKKSLALISVVAVVLGVGLFNAFSAQAVSSGTTIRGAIGGDFDSELPAGSVNGADWGVDETLRPAADNAIHDGDVFVQGPNSVDSNSAECPGTAAHPTATPGVVCIYILQSDNAANVEGLSIAPGTGGSRFGFKVLWDSSAHNGDTFLDATWAYKFP